MIVFYCLKIIEFIIRIMPIRWALSLAKIFGRIAYHMDRRHRQIALRNLTFAFPDKGRKQLQQIAKGAFQNMVMVGVEMIVLSKKDPKELYQTIEIVGEEHLEKARKTGKGVLFITGHTGNWETLACLGGVINILYGIVARRINNPWINRWINSIRERYGVSVIEKGKIREMVNAFEKGNKIGTLIDQDGGAKGIFVPFLGRLASTPSGLVRLGIKAGVNILPIFVRRMPGCLKFRIVVKPDISFVVDTMNEEEKVHEVIKRFAYSLETFIKESPDQWLWLHRRWKTTPEEEKKEQKGQILVINDGKKGHFNQIQGVLHSMDFDDFDLLKLDYRSCFHRAVLYIIALLRFPSFYMLRWALSEDSQKGLPTLPPRMVMACGSSSAPVLYILSAYFGAKSVLCMKSAFPMPGTYFDLVILPRHDCKKENKHVIALTTGTSSVCVSQIEEESELLIRSLGLETGDHIGVLVGGTSSRSEMTEKYLMKLYDVLEELAIQLRKSVIVVSSRRTPSSIEKIFQRKTKKGIYFIGVEEQRFQPVAALLGTCELLCVTEDSFSMICEAIHALKPVISIAVEVNKGKRFKFEDSLNAMMSMRFLRRSNLFELVNQGRIYYQSPWKPSREALERERVVVTSRVKNLLVRHR